MPRYRVIFRDVGPEVHLQSSFNRRSEGKGVLHIGVRDVEGTGGIGANPYERGWVIDRYDQKTVGRILGLVDISPDNECITWTGCENGRGYGQLHYKRKTSRVHKVLYEITNGPVTEGLELDHICKNRKCVNTNHLRTVTHAENLVGRIHTHCNRGHEYIEGSYYQYKKQKVCKECARIRKAA